MLCTAADIFQGVLRGWLMLTFIILYFVDNRCANTPYTKQASSTQWGRNESGTVQCTSSRGTPHHAKVAAAGWLRCKMRAMVRAHEQMTRSGMACRCLVGAVLVDFSDRGPRDSYFSVRYSAPTDLATGSFLSISQWQCHLI